MSRLFGSIRQMGYVVRDVEQAMKHWVEVCGIGPWYYIDKLPVENFQYRGQTGSPHLSIALANDVYQRALDLGYEVGQEANSVRGRFVYFFNEGHPGTVIEMAHYTPERRRIFDAVREAAIDWDGSDPIRYQWP